MHHAHHVGRLEGFRDADGESHGALGPEGTVPAQGLGERHPVGRLQREVERAAGRDAALVHRGDRGRTDGQRGEAARVVAQGSDEVLVAGGVLGEDAQGHARSGVGALREVHGVLDPGQEGLDRPVRAVDARERELGGGYRGKCHRRLVIR